jgi:hypothetical protein
MKTDLRLDAGDDEFTKGMEMEVGCFWILHY